MLDMMDTWILVAFYFDIIIVVIVYYDTGSGDTFAVLQTSTGRQNISLIYS